MSEKKIHKTKSPKPTYIFDPSVIESACEQIENELVERPKEVIDDELQGNET